MDQYDLWLVGVSDSSEALALFSDMWVQHPGFSMDPFLLSVALKACGLGGELTYGGALHGYSVKSGFVNSLFVGSALVDMYMKTGEINMGCGVFDEMLLRNVVSWTSVITGLFRAGYGVEGLACFAEMCRCRVQCDGYAFAIAMKACADLGALKFGREVHAQAMKKGFGDNSFVANSLATLYNKCQEDRAMKAFLRMLESGVRPNEYTFAAVISGCANLARVDGVNNCMPTFYP
ncbi:hypothetical protein ACLB2K_016510 [Fragaria x ananassa]